MYLCFIWFIFISNLSDLFHRNKNLVLKTNIFLDNSSIVISFFSLRDLVSFFFFFFFHPNRFWPMESILRSSIHFILTAANARIRSSAFLFHSFSYSSSWKEKNARIDLVRPFGCLEERKKNCAVIVFTWFTFFVWLVECLLLACSLSVYSQLNVIYTFLFE